MIRMTLIVVATIFIFSAIAVANGQSTTKNGLTHDGVLAQGHAKYRNGNYEGALEEYKIAKEMDAGNSLSYYFIGCTKAKLMQFDDAISLLTSAATIAGEKDLNVHGKALFMVAMVQEQKKDWVLAKKAWDIYVKFANEHKKEPSFNSTAQERIVAIEKKQKINNDYKSLQKTKEKNTL